MINLHHQIDDLEAACEDKDSLAKYYVPQLATIADTIKLLPQGEQEVYMTRLERISTILQGQMMALAEELEVLRKLIPAAQVNSAAARAYGRNIAVIPVKRDSGDVQ